VRTAKHRPEPGTEQQAPSERRIISIERGLSSAAAGAAAGVAVALFVDPGFGPLAGWTVAAAVLLVRVWWVSWPMDQDGTERLAEAESRLRSTDAWVLVAALASLCAVGEGMARSSQQDDPAAVVLVALALVAVILSWALVHTVFALKYARLYYRDSDGGIDFHQDRPPTYSDFAHLAFTVGMTYGVTDTQPTESRVRRTLLGHALLSYLFGTGILAVALNLVTGFQG
jgi:uncharacterized membrane protein